LEERGASRRALALRASPGFAPAALDASYKRDLAADTYAYISPVIERITGRSAEEMLALTMPELMALFHAEDLERIRQDLARALAKPAKRLERGAFRRS